MQTDDRLVQAALTGNEAQCGALVLQELSPHARRFRRGILTYDGLLDQVMSACSQRFDRLFGTAGHPGPLRGKDVPEPVLAALGIPASWVCGLPADLPAPKYCVNDTNQIVSVFSLRLPASPTLSGAAADVGLSLILSGEYGVYAPLTIRALRNRRYPNEEFTYDAEGFIQGYTTRRVRPLTLCWRAGKGTATLSFALDQSGNSRADRLAFEAHWTEYCAYSRAAGLEQDAFFRSFADRLIQAASEEDKTHAE